MTKCVEKKDTISTFPNLFTMTNNYITNQLIPQLTSYKAIGHLGRRAIDRVYGISKRPEGDGFGLKFFA